MIDIYEIPTLPTYSLRTSSPTSGKPLAPSGSLLESPQLTRASSHGSQVSSYESPEVSPCNLGHWEHESWGITTSHGVPSLKFPSMTWMPTWQHFLEVMLMTRVDKLCCLLSVWWSTHAKLMFLILFWCMRYLAIFFIYIVNQFGIYVHGNMTFCGDGVLKFSTSNWKIYEIVIIPRCVCIGEVS